MTHCDVSRVASRSNASEAQALKRRHFQWLLESGQDEQAARVKERDGDFVGAITLFLQGGLPAKAAQVNCHPSLHCPWLPIPCTFSLFPLTTLAVHSFFMCQAAMTHLQSCARLCQATSPSLYLLFLNLIIILIVINHHYNNCESEILSSSVMHAATQNTAAPSLKYTQ